jgi:hypothetical protein
VTFLDRGTTENSDLYMQILKKLQEWIPRVRRKRKKNEVLLLHDNARLHANLRTRGGNWNKSVDCAFSSSIQSRFSTLRLPSFRPPEGCTTMTPSCRRRAETQCAWRVPKIQQSFTRPASSVSCKGGKTVLITKEILWKNYFNLVKDVSMIYINFILIAIIVSEKKWEEKLSYRPSNIIHMTLQKLALLQPSGEWLPLHGYNLIFFVLLRISGNSWDQIRHLQNTRLETQTLTHWDKEIEANSVPNILTF